MLRPNFLRDKLMAGAAVLGTWAVVPSPMLIDILGTAGLDFVVIDGEHGAVGFETAQQMVIAAESRDMSPVIRISGVSEPETLKALDIGAHCIQIPNIGSRVMLERAIRHAKFPPVGDRGFSPFVRAADYTHENGPRFSREANANSLLAIHVEGREAVEGIDDILDVSALDIVFLGRYDISKSLGIPGQTDHPSVLDVMRTAATKIEDADKVAGTILTDIDELPALRSMGIRYFTFSVDCEMIRRAYKSVSTRFREAQQPGPMAPT
jgi:4-hydroxy-2-oxoheptanedioate aldolase